MKSELQQGSSMMRKMLSDPARVELFNSQTNPQWNFDVLENEDVFHFIQKNGSPSRFEKNLKKKLRSDLYQVRKLVEAFNQLGDKELIRVNTNIRYLEPHKAEIKNSPYYRVLFSDVFNSSIVDLTLNESDIEVQVIASHQEDAEETTERVFKAFEGFKNVQTKNLGSTEFHMISQDNYGFNLTKFNVRDVDLNIDDHYNNDFDEVDKYITTTVNGDSVNGIVLLSGPPGTGKTTYIRHLIRNLEKKIIYVPPNLTNAISDPSFVEFISKHENSILIVEDAENVLLKRDAGSTQAVSNILNLSDGILGDALKLTIVATFNTEISDIDPAIRRKGRLIAEYYFGELTLEKTRNLMKKLYGDEVTVSKEMTLAEIYGHGEPDWNGESDKKPFGFV